MSLGEMFAAAMSANSSRPAYRHDQNYEWHCPVHHVEWKGQLSSRCWVEGCEAVPIKKIDAVRIESANKLRAERGEGPL